MFSCTQMWWLTLVDQIGTLDNWVNHGCYHPLSNHAYDLIQLLPRPYPFLLMSWGWSPWPLVQVNRRLFGRWMKFLFVFSPALKSADQVHPSSWVLNILMGECEWRVGMQTQRIQIIELMHRLHCWNILGFVGPKRIFSVLIIWLEACTQLCSAAYLI